MNAERLHAIALTLRDEMNSTKIVAEMEVLCTSLDRVVSQNHPSHQEQLANSLRTVYTRLNNSTIQNLSPVWRQLLSEMGGDGLFGRPLKSAIEGIIQGNQLTPAVALKELRQLRERLESFQKGLDSA